MSARPRPSDAPWPAAWRLERAACAPPCARQTCGGSPPLPLGTAVAMPRVLVSLRGSGAIGGAVMAALRGARCASLCARTCAAGYRRVGVRPMSLEAAAVRPGLGLRQRARLSWGGRLISALRGIREGTHRPAPGRWASAAGPWVRAGHRRIAPCRGTAARRPCVALESCAAVVQNQGPAKLEPLWGRPLPALAVTAPPAKPLPVRFRAESLDDHGFAARRGRGEGMRGASPPDWGPFPYFRAALRRRCANC